MSTDPFIRQPLPDYPWEQYPDEDPDAWDGDIPVNADGEIEEGSEYADDQ